MSSPNISLVAAPALASRAGLRARSASSASPAVYSWNGARPPPHFQLRYLQALTLFHKESVQTCRMPSILHTMAPAAVENSSMCHLACMRTARANHQNHSPNAALPTWHAHTTYTTSQHHSIIPAWSRFSPAETSKPAASRFGNPIFARKRAMKIDAKPALANRDAPQSEKRRRTSRSSTAMMCAMSMPIHNFSIATSFCAAMRFCDAFAMFLVVKWASLLTSQVAGSAGAIALAFTVCRNRHHVCGVF